MGFSPIIGFFITTHASEVVVRKWDQQEERIAASPHHPPVPASQLPLRFHLNVAAKIGARRLAIVVLPSGIGFQTLSSMMQRRRGFANPKKQDVSHVSIKLITG